MSKVRIKTFKLIFSKILFFFSYIIVLANKIYLTIVQFLKRTTYLFLFFYRFRKTNKVTSVWGGVLQDIYVKHPDNLYKKSRYHVLRRMDDPLCVALLITGCIQTWSMILDKKCETKEQAEERLRRYSTSSLVLLLYSSIRSR